MWSVHPTSPQLHYSCYSSQLWSGVRFQPEKNPRVRKQIIQRSSSHELPFFDWQDEAISQPAFQIWWIEVWDHSAT